ncbi:MAG: hypothetical protein LBD95_04250 [Clostridiales Family XIII bacterium]|jgi:hypothetical protein|nr:hypothetical protein [Clostridiales Family XIII bacterium]
MRKSIGVFFMVLLPVLLLSTATCFAEGLRLVENYPEEGSRSSPPINLGIKLFFDRDVSTEAYRAQNEACFKLLDEEDRSVPLRVLYTDADRNYILVVAEPENEKEGLGSDREYRFEISPELQAADDSTLETQKVITFRTRNTSRDMTVNMVLMGVMVVGMLVFSTLSMRRQARKAAAATADKQRVNPYKVAKETGKSVTEIVAKEEKRKRQAAKRRAGAGASAADKDADAKDAESAAAAGGRRVKHVRAPRPIAAAGSGYKTGRKAAAEKKAREEAAQRAKGTTKPKARGGATRSKRRK